MTSSVRVGSTPSFCDPTQGSPVQFNDGELQAMRNVYKDTPMRLVELTSDELNSFAGVFSHGVESPRLKALLTWLPERLKCPEQWASWTQQSASQFYRDIGFDIPLPATLCEAHTSLNAALVQDALAGVLSEADEGIEELVNSIGGLDCIPERLRHRVIDEAQAFLAADSTITAGEFYYFHRRQPPDLWWKRQHLQPCCLLGKVANTPSLLSALRACRLASLSDDFILEAKTSLRLALVESWIYALEPQKALDIISISSAYGAQLRDLRKPTSSKQSGSIQRSLLSALQDQPLSMPPSIAELNTFAASKPSSNTSDVCRDVSVPLPLNIRTVAERPASTVRTNDRRPVSSFYGPPTSAAASENTLVLANCSPHPPRAEASWDPWAALRMSDMSPPPIDFGSKPSGNYWHSSIASFHLK